MLSSLQSQKGFLLADLLIAIMVCVALLALGGAYLQFSKSTANSANYTAAANLAQLYMERFKAAQNSTAEQQFHVTAVQTPDIDAEALIPKNQLPPIYQGYTVAFSHKASTTSDATSGKTLVAYTISVSWPENGKTLKADFVTYIPQR